jgi:hypothetical protein
MPCAPAFIAVCTARFIARRNETRPASWSATPCAISVASSSGCLISWMLKWIFGLPVILQQPGAQAVGLGAAAPMTMPGARCTRRRAAVARALDLDAAHRGACELLRR